MFINYTRDFIKIFKMEEKSKVGKALLALIVTVVMGLLGTAFGYDEMNGFSEVGAVVAIAVMGAFIIYFNEKKK